MIMFAGVPKNCANCGRECPVTKESIDTGLCEKCLDQQPPDKHPDRDLSDEERARQGQS